VIFTQIWSETASLSSRQLERFFTPKIFITFLFSTIFNSESFLNYNVNRASTSGANQVTGHPTYHEVIETNLSALQTQVSIKTCLPKYRDSPLAVIGF